MVRQLYRDSMDLAFRSAAWGIDLLARGVGAAARMLPDTGPDSSTTGPRKRSRKTRAQRSSVGGTPQAR